MCPPPQDVAMDRWRRRCNKKLCDMVGVAPVTSWNKGQRLQWFEHIMRREENNIVNSAIEWKPLEKITRGRPRKRWIDSGEEDLK